MLDASEPVFPDNAITLLAARLPSIDPEPDLTKERVQIFKRPLRSSDPTQSIGVFANTWNPMPESFETRGQGAAVLGMPRASEPSLSRYTIGVQAFVKDMDEERGLIVHSVMAKRIRTLLAWDGPLHVGFGALSVTMSGSTERAQRWGVQSQRFLSNEVEGSFLHLSTLEFWLETETVV